MHNKKKDWHVLCRLTLLIQIILAGCTAPRDHQKTISFQAKRLRAVSEVIHTDIYQLQTLQITPGKAKTLRVYIEGDGRAWARRDRPSTDPTPRGLLVFDLMAADSCPDKAYVARPCQFVIPASCEIKVWTDLRYSQSAVSSLNTALDKLKDNGKYRSLELVGFSGGATLALLAASQRSDIQSVRTVAGNLSPHFVNRFHKVSPMPFALDPADLHKELSRIPQIHFYGDNDPVITPQVFQSYKNRFQQTKCIHGMKVSGASHQGGWIENWPNLLKKPLPSCKPEN